jgi:argininosuccinate synthase
MSTLKDVKKVVLAYSGGLDTSIILKWLQTELGAEVVTFTADLGQGGELEPARRKAEMLGIKDIRIMDVREEFVKDFVFPMFRANALYEGVYLLGTSIARPLIAKKQIEIARKVGADAVCHGATGKGNDQVRFELSYAAFAPGMQIIAPWREWDVRSREDAIEFAEARGISLNVSKEKIYSRDRNLWHVSHEGGCLEDPAYEPPKDLFMLTVAPEDAPNAAEYIEIGFESGYPVTINGEAYGPVEMVLTLNEIGGRHGIGRADIIEDRLVGMKSRGIYETPGGTLLYTAHKELEQIVLDRRALALKDSLALRYADLVYDGRWWTTEREALDAMVDATQKRVTGSVRLKLYKGNVIVAGRQSPMSIYDQALASFGSEGSYDHADADGFLKLFAIPTAAEARQGIAE